MRYLLSIAIACSVPAFAQSVSAPQITGVTGAGGTPLLSPSGYGLIFGSNFGTQPALVVGGQDAKITAVTNTSIAFQVPATTAIGSTTVIVRNAGLSSTPFPIAISEVSPSILNNSIRNPPTYFFDFTPGFTLIYSQGPGDRVTFYAQGLGSGQPPPAPQVFIDRQQIPVIAIGTADAHFGSSAASSLTPFTTLTIELPFSLRGGLHTLSIQAKGVMSPAVTFTLYSNGIILSHTGLTFNAVEGAPSPPAQAFSVLSGSGTINFSVSTSTVTGSGWLSASPTSGTAVAGQTGAPVHVTVNSSALKAGVYYGAVQVSSADATNSPQSLTIVLNIEPAATRAGPILDTTGLIFSAAPGGTNPAPQSVTIFNPTSRALTYTSSLTAGAAAFTYSPVSGNINAGQSITLSVQASVKGLSESSNAATLTLSFSDGSARTVNLLLVIATGAGIVSKEFREAAGCAPKKLLPVFTLLGDSFNVRAAWPTPIEVTIVDDCSTAMVSGVVSVAFSNGDPALTLVSLRNGKWTTTWPPANPRTSGIVVTATALQHETNLTGTTKVSGGVLANSDIPILAHGGIVDTASYGQAPAPGDLIAIFGTNLSLGVAGATSLPLSTELMSTSVLVAGQLLPLIYTSDGQVNAVIPYDLPLNSKLQVVARRSTTVSVPESFVIGVARPAVFTLDSSGKGQGHIYRIDSRGNQVLADEKSPAKSGDVLVVYCAGLGAVDPPVAAGVPAPSSVLTKATNPVSVAIGGRTANVMFAGLTPGFTGLYQVNVVVPDGLPNGDTTSLMMSVAGQDSPDVTLAIRNSP